MLNNTILVGRITKDLQLYESANGNRFVKFTVACDGAKGKTDFVPVTAFGVMAENLCTYKGKGDLIAIEGSLKSSSWKDVSGQNRFSLDVIADNIQYLDNRSRASARAETVQQAESGCRPVQAQMNQPKRIHPEPTMHQSQEPVPAGRKARQAVYMPAEPEVMVQYDGNVIGEDLPF